MGFLAGANLDKGQSRVPVFQAWTRSRGCWLPSTTKSFDSRRFPQKNCPLNYAWKGFYDGVPVAAPLVATPCSKLVFAGPLAIDLCLNCPNGQNHAYND